MLLRTSLTSPFGRKIRMASLRLGLTHRIQTVSADTTDPADEIRIDNPLGKVPLLVLDDGRRIYDGIAPLALDLERRLLSRLDPGERAALDALLDKLAGGIAHLADAPP